MHTLTRWSLTAGLCLATCATAALATRAEPSSAELQALVETYDLDVADTPVRERAGWKPPTRIVVAADAQRVQWLQSAAPDVDLVPVASRTQALDAIQDAQAVIGLCSAELLARGDALRWVQILSAGAERCVRLPEFAARKPLLTNMQRISAPVIAEHVIAMMLSLSRQLPAFEKAARTGRWARDPAITSHMQVIRGKTMLVAGLGGIGTEVARRAHALGMTVIATRNSSTRGPEFVAEVGLADRLPDMATRADVIVSALPLTDETVDLFDAELFAKMKDTALFINVGRGGSVVTDDLLAALNKGTIAGAGLDVTDPEPLPTDHPLWHTPNVIITPHVSSRSDLPREARWQVVYENLRRYANGEQMLSVVRPARGY